MAYGVARYLLLALCVLSFAACSSSSKSGATATPKAATAGATRQATERSQNTAIPATRAAPATATIPPAAVVPTDVPPAPAVPTIAPQPPATGVVYSCEDGDCNCSDFPTHAEAQRVFLKHGGSPTNNWSRLDNNHNGIACESLP